MLKKFVPLDGEVSASQTPYDIRTFKSPAYEDIPKPLNIDPCCYGTPPKPCTPGNISVTEPMTKQEDIFRLFDIPVKLRLQRCCKKRCKKFDDYTACIMNQRSPELLKRHAIVRENYLKTKAEMMLRVHDAQEPSSNDASLIRVDSPIVTEGKVQPKLASPSCSLETFYVPSRKLLDLKRPRSGIFINETPRPTDADIPFESYNPRKLQEKLNGEERRKYTLFSDGNRFYFPWMQGAGDMNESNNKKADALRQECIHFKPAIFPIPNDLYKTFSAAIVFGNEAISLVENEDNAGLHRPIEVACLFAAYVESFSKNPDYWSAKTMDSVLENGIELCEKSKESRYEDPNADFDIIPELTKKQATIKTKVHLTGPLTNEPNILKALTLFFDKFQAGILISADLYILIWKRCANSFYIFDPNGRDIQCRRDFSKGKACLMVILTVEHIVHLILNSSNVRSDAEFSLYEIALEAFGKLSKPLNLNSVKPPRKRFTVVNRYYAIIPALSGITLPPPVKSQNDNASMMISYLALVYSQMDPPKHWTTQLVDDLIRFGKKYNSEYTADNRLEALNVVDLPEVLLFGNYRVLVEKKAFVASGHVVDCWSYRVSQLTLAINDFLSEYDTGLLQVDSSTFGLWKDENMILVFDPFRRGPAGQAFTTSKVRTGCLQIHLNMTSLCRIMFMNANSIKTGGNFFLHAIRVKAIGTFNTNRSLEDAAVYGTLHIKYPLNCERAQLGKHEQGQESEYEDTDYNEKILKSGFQDYNLMQCLSQLSLTPCQRTCNEREFLLHQHKQVALRKKLTEQPSITSIEDEFKISEFDNVDVIDSIVAVLICDVMTTIERKTEKRPKVCIQASKVLLQSDKRHLEDLQLRLKRGEDYDNICEGVHTKPPAYNELTLDEELAMESNFRALPDGSWAIFGVTDMDSVADTLKGILATITAAALSSKYNVSTWSSDVIEYALETSAILEERFWSYNHTLDLIFRKQIPKIQLGSATYYIKVVANETVAPDKLKSFLDGALLRVNKLFLICKGLSCLIVKRYNFIYMFMGCPCDVVGFRSKSSGPMCLLRFLETTTLVRRIENACGRSGKYVVVELDVKNVTEPRQKFIQRTVSQEDLLYNRELNEKEKQTQRNKEKMKFIQHELRKETKRLKDFKKEKLRPKSKKGKKKVKISTRSSISETGSNVENEYGEEEELYEESDKSIEFKHKPGKSLEMGEEEQEMVDETFISPELGYQLRDVDYLFKIQGSKALGERLESAVDKIKTCFFASAIALLYAILRPLNHWNSQRIDKVIQLAENIAKTTTNFNTASERIINNIDVDEFTFQVKVELFTPVGSFGGDLKYKIKKTIETQHYFMLQISNGTFAVHRDQYYHLFDPYSSMETAAGGGEEYESKYPSSIEIRPEQNTASWILFADIETMMGYIEKRAASKEWKTEYKLHIVNVLSYKTVPKRKQLLNLLTDELNTNRKIVESPNLCTYPEEIEWLDIYPNLVIWSRLNRSNAIQRVRGSSLTKENNFDIEIPDKLYSLWGSIHPASAVFGASRGKQHLAINVVACCVASVYQVTVWNTQILDSIVINGNDFYKDSVATINRKDYEISLENLNTVFSMGHLRFEVHLESVTYGYLYTTAKRQLNLAAALTHFFTNHRYGVIQCMNRSVAIGKLDSGFFMFDCQNHGVPLFPNGQGAAYVLRTNQLQILLYCIVMTLNISNYSTQFTIHKVEMLSEKVNEQAENEGEDE